MLCREDAWVLHSTLHQHCQVTTTDHGLPRQGETWIVSINLRKGESPKKAVMNFYFGAISHMSIISPQEKHGLHGDNSSSVLLKLFGNSYERCHTTDAKLVYCHSGKCAYQVLKAHSR